jgi:diguanylate cyclase (GGDEF)-like protein
MSVVRGSWSKRLYALTVPGGVLLIGAVLLLNSTLLPRTADPLLHFFPYLAYLAAALLALRFHAPRVVLAAILLLITQTALDAEPFAAGTAAAAVFVLLAILLPANLGAMSFLRENRLLTEVTAYWLAVLGMEAVVVTLICQPETYRFGVSLGGALLPWEITRLPQLALVLFFIAAVLLAARFFQRRDPVDNAFLWALLACACGLQAHAAGRDAGPYLGLAGLLLAVGLIETSYRLAYYDQLTALPARRAFQEATENLPPRYTVAMVDIDHFKKFNDLFGHEVGDHVLRMVASRLADVGGDGEAFRWGGEEFAILFRGKALEDAAPWLEEVRQAVEESGFIVRQGAERRQARRGGKERRGARTPKVPQRVAGVEVFVTVSMGAAENVGRTQALEEVLRTADKALYRAKENGRNRLELDRPAPRPKPTAKPAIARN